MCNKYNFFNTYIEDVVVAHLPNVPALLLGLVEVPEAVGPGQHHGPALRPEAPSGLAGLAARQPAHHLVQLNKKNHYKKKICRQ